MSKTNCTGAVDMCKGNKLVKLDLEAVKLEPEFDGAPQLAKHHKPEIESRRQDCEENRSSNALSTGQSSSSVLEQGPSPMDDTGVSSRSPVCPAPLCRQFWKAGNYNDGLGSKVTLQNGKSYLHVHPMFLHSNATSHKWAFGAIAELLDNAIDEIQNGASFVSIDVTSNPRDGCSALLIQDDGGGMDPEAMRCCMSFGFSDKKSKSAIGKYGNGFKTSSMRLGADVIVFSRHVDERNKMVTQSIGLLSYTFLTQTGLDRIIVPMVDYKLNTSTNKLEVLHGREHFMSNLSILLQWSPYSTEVELLKQFDNIGTHGTRVIIYNLWLNDEGNVELDFNSDPEDIRIGGQIKHINTLPAWKAVNEQHVANRLHYSLRVYLSILYLRIPENFKIILRGQEVEHHRIARDLQFQEFILYKPQSSGFGSVITTIGFLKEAPQVNIHGFNVYHKNRLILPFWQVVSYSDSRGRGVVGVLEANFIEPTHNKQDFERTPLFQKLELRLKQMTFEYWDYHCGLIGYQQVKKKPRAQVLQESSVHGTPKGSIEQPVILSRSSPAAGSLKAQSAVTGFQQSGAGSYQSLVGKMVQAIPNSNGRLGQGIGIKRRDHPDLEEQERLKRQELRGVNVIDDRHHSKTQPAISAAAQFKNQEAINLMEENKKLKKKCLEYETMEKELNLKATHLRRELLVVQRDSDQLLAELKSLDPVKEEKDVNM